MEGRYQILGAQGEIVRDIVTGLEWQRCSLGQTWDGRTCVGEAQTFTWEKARFAGNRVPDWRLPTVDELKSLTYCSSGAPAHFTNGQMCQGEYRRPTIAQEAFPNTPSLSFWSGSLNTNFSSSAWSVDVGNGSSSVSDLSSSFRVRLVRDAP